MGYLLVFTGFPPLPYRYKIIHGELSTPTSNQKPFLSMLSLENGKRLSILFVGVVVKMRALHQSRFSETQIQQRLDTVFEGKVKIKPGTYTGFDRKCWFVDVEFGEWEAFPQNVFRGLGHPSRSRLHGGETRKLTRPEIEHLVLGIHGDEVRLIGEYQGMLVPTLFESKTHGTFMAIPANVIHKKTEHPKAAVLKRENTTMKRLGVKYWVQDEAKYNEYLKTLHNVFYEKNWKTGENQACRGKWELAVVRWLNELKVDYLWQPKTFVTPSGKTYRPDCYVISWNTWIEVKGMWREGSKEKWEWFHSVYPNSELWDKKELKALQII
jgi:hypothetical protein